MIQGGWMILSMFSLHITSSAAAKTAQDLLCPSKREKGQKDSTHLFSYFQMTSYRQLDGILKHPSFSPVIVLIVWQPQASWCLCAVKDDVR